MQILPSPLEKRRVSIASEVFIGISKDEFLRFDWNREPIYIFKNAVLFVQSAGHYIKALVRFKGKKIWATRYSSFQEIGKILQNENFMVLNRFYLVNKKELIGVKEEIIQGTKKRLTLFFDGEFRITLEHSVSEYVKRLLLQA